MREPCHDKVNAGAQERAAWTVKGPAEAYNHNGDVINVAAAEATPRNPPQLVRLPHRHMARVTSMGPAPV